MPVAVNVSARSFQDHHFVQSVKNALEIADVSPEYLELEITENMLMSNIDFAAKIIKSLSDLGVRIAIDNFGTGYSSPSYLKRLPIDQLNIDKSFVKNMDRDNNAAAIVMSVIDWPQSRLHCGGRGRRTRCADANAARSRLRYRPGLPH